MKRKPAIRCDDAAWTCAGAAVARRNDLEFELLAAVLWRPTFGVPEVSRLSNQPVALFADMRHRLAWVAIEYKPSASCMETLMLIRRLLIAEGEWWNGRDIEWLASLATRQRWFVSPITRIVGELSALAALMRRANEMHSRAIEMWERAANPLPLTIHTNAFHYQPARAQARLQHKEPAASGRSNDAAAKVA